jgi:hypothetical protein
MTMKLATGDTEESARKQLTAAHAQAADVKEPLAAAELVEPSLPQYSAPKRVARRPAKKGPELRGHPLD